MCICIVRREGKKEHGVQSRHQEVMSVFVGKEHQKPLFILFASSSLFFNFNTKSNAKELLEKKKKKKKKRPSS